jgi:hypothetical protein
MKVKFVLKIINIYVGRVWFAECNIYICLPVVLLPNIYFEKSDHSFVGYVKMLRQLCDVESNETRRILC